MRGVHTYETTWLCSSTGNVSITTAIVVGVDFREVMRLLRFGGMLFRCFVPAGLD